MRIDKNIVEKKYNIFNEKYFDNSLPKIKFRTHISKNTWGIMSYYYSAKWKNNISIARNVEWNETELDKTIIHEMIHFYLLLYDKRYNGKNFFYNRSHGILFKEQAKKIKKIYNIDISTKIKYSYWLNKKGKKEKPSHNPFIIFMRWFKRYIL